MIHRRLQEKIWILKFLQRQELQFKEQLETIEITDQNYNYYLEVYHRYLLTTSQIKKIKKIITQISC